MIAARCSSHFWIDINRIVLTCIVYPKINFDECLSFHVEQYKWERLNMLEGHNMPCKYAIYIYIVIFETPKENSFFFIKKLVKLISNYNQLGRESYRLNGYRGKLVTSSCSNQSSIPKFSLQQLLCAQCATLTFFSGWFSWLGTTWHVSRSKRFFF